MENDGSKVTAQQLATPLFTLLASHLSAGEEVEDFLSKA